MTHGGCVLAATTTVRTTDTTATRSDARSKRPPCRIHAHSDTMNVCQLHVPTFLALSIHVPLTSLEKEDRPPVLFHFVRCVILSKSRVGIQLG